jgi:TonB family protein
VRLAAALARGELVEPHWIARVRDAAGELVAVPETASPQRIWEPEIADALRRSLRGVTERGTARRAFRNARGEPLLGDVAVAGKTGTLHGEDPQGLYHWFVGVAPAEQPRIAIAALVVHGQETSCAGGRVAPLYARASARRAEATAELAAQRAASERARIAADRVVPARLLEKPDLDMPVSLRHRKLEGEVVLLVSLAPSGEVAEVRVEASDLPERFGRYVSEAARGWKFAPATRGGDPIGSDLRLRIPIQVR